MKAILILSLMLPVFAFGKSYKSKRGKRRKPAAATLTVNDLSAGFVNLQNDIIGAKGEKGIQTADQLDALIRKVDAEYPKYKDDSQKLLAAQLAFSKVYRGIIYRAKDLVKDHDFVRSGIITALRLTGQATQVYLPNSQWEAGFNYTVEPFDFDKNQVAKINSDETFKKYLKKELIPALTEFETRVKGINFNNVVWDNRVFYRDANFVDDKDRFVRLSDNEKNALRSVISASLSSSKGLVAFSLKGLFDTIDKVSKKYGVNAMFDTGGSLAEARTEIIKDNLNLKLRDSAALKRSYEDLQKSVRFAKKAVEGVKKDGRNGDSWNLLNFTAINAFSRINNNVMENISNIALPENNRTIASAVVSGEVVEVDLKAFFVTDQPKDLLAFLPNEFDTRMNKGREKNSRIRKHPVMLKKNGKRYIDFTYGRPIGWKQKEFQKYFPNVKSDQDIKRVVRVISQSYGAAGIGGPLSLVMF